MLLAVPATTGEAEESSRSSKQKQYVPLWYVSEGDHAATVAGVHGGNKDMSLRALPLVLVAGACVGEGPEIDIGWVDKTLGHGSSDRFCRVLNDNRSMVSGIMHTGSAGFGSLRRSMRRSLNRNRQGQQNYLVALLICIAGWDLSLSLQGYEAADCEQQRSSNNRQLSPTAWSRSSRRSSIRKST